MPTQASTATTFSSDMEPRFKALANKSPALTRSQVAAQLAQAPAIDPKVYYTWLGQYAATQAKQRLAQGPITTDAIKSQLQTTQYNDPQSIFPLLVAVGSPTGIQRVPWGTYQPDGTQQRYTCFLQAQPGTLPQDIPPSELRGNANVTQVKCSVANSPIPEFIVQIGNLCVSQDSKSQAATVPQTSFVVGINPTDRQVYAFWNPLGVTPQTLDGGDPAKRQSTGALPGFTKQCIAVRMGASIDDVLKDPAYAFKFTSANDFLTLPSDATVQFGGVDADGWTRLDKIGRFATVPQLSTSAARGG